MNEIMQRQESLGLDIPDAVAIVGCGGVGCWTAYFLALAGVPELWLFDMDTVSEHNLNRLPLPITSVGKRKSVALAELIHTVRPKCNVLTMGIFSNEIVAACDLQDSVQWVVATTDTLASRRLVKKWAEVHYGMNYIEAAAEGEMGSCTADPADWSTPQEAQPGYQSVPVWVGPCVFSAGIAVAHILHCSTPGDRVLRMGWDKLEGQFSIFDSEKESKVNG